ncbi:MAG: hypothetical protein UT34_C0002G0177 [candidate division WS6 bacterium GW2011_GWF2_39_15]|uniref:DUF4349 domain-containing protein n=1 Tax=candidate division WS6 bacterium GW2011_GWF2_39_15 TaxID=1619100 RepID=A0A0G0Q5I5_9BACT|nr:MAG: hypothetical protein UT34_C0002G0177 [candidate division WS6 bacterium GW2011_GWF2_39_15]
MTDKKFTPKNFTFIITVASLGLILLSILVFLYQAFVTDWSESSVNPTDSVVGSTEEGSGEGVVADYDKGMPDVLPAPDDSTATSEKDQKVVKTGTLNIAVDDFDDVDAKVRSDVKKVGGFVASTNDTGVEKDRTLVMTVKIPASSFDGFIDKVKGYASVVNSYTESATDVTKAYQDLQARLKNEKSLETALVGILDKATKVSDILEVQRQLSSVRQNIEVYESQIKYYDSQIDMSTITISMSLSSESLDVTGDEWQPGGIFREAVKALVALGKDLGTLGIWMVVFSPVILLLYLLAKWIVRKLKVS